MQMGSRCRFSSGGDLPTLGNKNPFPCGRDFWHPPRIDECKDLTMRAVIDDICFGLGLFGCL
jgi:hypothetical protein